MVRSSKILGHLVHRCTRGGGGRGEGGTSCTPTKVFKKTIKHDPPDFLTTPSTPLKRICQKKPKDPGFPTTVHLWFSLKI